MDRDGVLTVEKSYVCSKEELEIFPYAEECIREMKQMGYYAIVVTNQSGVARGLFSEETLQEMNTYLVSKIGVDAVYYCPHYPDGTVAEYRISCNCRKPRIGMIQRACNDFDIDIEQSYMVGDRASDILLGKNAGLHTVLLESGYGSNRLEMDITPDYRANDLRDVVQILSKGGNNI